MYEQIVDYLSKNWSRLVGALIILFAGYLLARLILRIFKKALTRTPLDPAGHKFILGMIKILLYTLVIIIALSQLNVDMTSIVTMLGVGGLAVSLAVKDSLANVAGGFILLFSKSFKVGDYIEASGVSGTVQQINILQTKLNTPDNKAVYIPNGELSSAKITNFSAEPDRLLVIPLSIGYGDDIEQARKLALSIAQKDNRVITGSDSRPDPCLHVTGHGAHAIELSLRVWVNTADYWPVNFALLEQIKTAFDEAGITIPYNQLDVHMDKLPAQLS